MKSPNPSGSPAPASPFPVAKSAQAANPGLCVPVVIQPVLRRATLALSQNPLQKKGLLGWPSSERIRWGRPCAFMNSPGYRVVQLVRQQFMFPALSAWR